MVLLLQPSWAPIVSELEGEACGAQHSLVTKMALCAHNELVQTCTRGGRAPTVLGAHRE